MRSMSWSCGVGVPSIDPIPVAAPPSTPFEPPVPALDTTGRPDVVDPGTPGAPVDARPTREPPGAGRFVEFSGAGRRIERMTQTGEDTVTTGDGDALQVLTFTVRYEGVTGRPRTPDDPPAGQAVVIEYVKRVLADEWRRWAGSQVAAGRQVTEADAP